MQVLLNNIVQKEKCKVVITCYQRKWRSLLKRKSDVVYFGTELYGCLMRAVYEISLYIYHGHIDRSAREQQVHLFPYCLNCPG